MILDYNSLPVQDFVKRKRGQDKVIKATKGHKTRTVLVMDDGFVMLVSLKTKTLCKRLWEYSSPALR